MGLFGLGAFILLANLFYHQVLNEENRNLAKDRTLTQKSINAPRGIIYDRNDKLIVVNQPIYGLEMIYSEISDDMDKEAFCELLDITPEEYKDAMSAARSKRYFRRNLPIRFISDISPVVYSRFQEHLYRFRGFYPSIESRRSYPHPYAGHALGYVSEVSQKDLELSETYVAGDQKGSSGIERVYDLDLRGKRGIEYLLRDNIGRMIDSYQDGGLDSSAVPGHDIKTSLDIDLQALGEQLMKGKRGSIVAIEPSTGEILTMISSPTYNPNQLSYGKARSNTYLDLVRDTLNNPLLDRSVRAKYPPGSIFKPILSLIALQEGLFTPNRGMACDGEYVINRRRGFIQKCRHHPRPNNIQTALQHSCNTYYYQMMRELVDHYGYSEPSKGLSMVNEYLYQFGLGSPLGIDSDNESGGFVPTPKFYDDMYNTAEYSWRSTYILSLGIGQGELELTTVQMANLAAILANRGYFYTPHLVKSLSYTGLPHADFLLRHEVSIDSIHFPPVIDGMQRVVDAGTGWRARVPGLSVCGKTGTSQNPHGEDHSVFFGFAPRDNPQIAIAVYVENAGGGGRVAAPIGGMIMEKYINGEIAERRQAEQQRLMELDLISLP